LINKKFATEINGKRNVKKMKKGEREREERQRRSDKKGEAGGKQST
jgi:hypothetical protein